ncbi:MAG TPA: tetratricopeptide repeat protein [Nitrospira sp.]|jgi:outer membrane protein assembly factor BamD (BamD/ComL family)|nr:tetratricopeptide repeat protein [Nitrospira sp.]MBK9113864.1 tetratricopeptide repeat protein [Nitrospira sp.]MBP8825894.1 tetratricopeptide repeat protein [Nitrospira sp.]MBP9635319.1 tetratricopeptide repeat protein [Nitrospira sp.]HNP82459.1 tetratricopeptide repeat protein [Nitrospira sp.]
MSYRIKVPAKVDPLDEAHLLTGVERFLLVLQEQRRAVLVGLGVLLVAAAVVAGVIWYDYQATLKARELDQEATLHYLNRPADDPKKSHEQLAQAINLYKQVVDQYPRSPVAPLALFHLGNAQVLANEVDAGIETYKRFMLLHGSNTSLLGLVQQRMAYAYLVKGDRDQAVKAFTGILEIPGALNKDHVLFELAKLEESQSRPEGALAHYQDLMKNYPNSPFTSEAAVRVKVLEVKKSPESPAAAATPAPAVTAPAPQPEAPAKSSGKSAAASSKKKP